MMTGNRDFLLKFWLQTLVHSHRVSLDFSFASLSNTLYSYYLAPCPASELDIVRLKCDERLGLRRENRGEFGLLLLYDFTHCYWALCRM